MRVTGLENYKAAGDRVVIVANHQSYLDACLIAAYVPDSPTFAIHTSQAAKWYFKPFLARGADVSGRMCSRPTR